MQTLPPQRLADRDFADVERQHLAIFRDVLFLPVLRAGGIDLTLENAGDAVIRRAIRAGRIQYVAGVFSGDFTSATSRELEAIGAKWDPHQEVYRLAEGSVPPDIRAEAAAYESTAKAVHQAIGRKLDEISTDLGRLVGERRIDARKAVRNVDKGFRRVARDIVVTPVLTAEAEERLAQRYSDNAEPFIKDFLQKQILELRETVEQNARQGYRFDKLAQRIERRYAVSRNKANFLARQETSMFMAGFRRERFGDAGIKRYIWRGTKDARERPDHRALEGRVFFYDSPPVTDKATGARNNPGEDYNCRCADEPVLAGAAVAA